MGEMLLGGSLEPVQESDVGFTKDHRETIGLLVRAFDER